MKMKHILRITVIALAASLCTFGRAGAQHTIGVVGGTGMTNARLYPDQVRKATWGVFSGGVSWRYYSAPRYVGGIGVDLEFIQRGFAYAPDSYRHDEDKDYHYYSRMYNSFSLPLVWQPHVYLFKNRLRFYIELALNLEYNMSATYRYEPHNPEDGIATGTYTMKTVRDNMLGYGLAGGGGLDFLIGRFEVGVRVRYYFGLSDVMRNRNKYYDNGLDDPLENPFAYTPLRSPVDNLMISFKVGFRFNKSGFTEWTMPRKKRDKQRETFNFSLD